MSDWKDITSYSRGDADRTPRTWEIYIGKIRLIVTRKWLGKDIWSGWHVQCEPFLYLQIGGDDIDAIKSAALRELRNELAEHALLIETT